MTGIGRRSFLGGIAAIVSAPPLTLPEVVAPVVDSDAAYCALFDTYDQLARRFAAEQIAEMFRLGELTVRYDLAGVPYQLLTSNPAIIAGLE